MLIHGEHSHNTLCSRYEDGAGGCDGCLNWHGVGHRFQMSDLKYSFSQDDIKETNNNGLEYAVAILEELYVNPDFPSKTEKLPVSLRASGKSRADLWAFAAKVAVEYATEQNNYACAGRPRSWVGDGGSPVSGHKDCMRNLGEEDCEVILPREIDFHYGRADCVSEYPGEWEQFKTDRPETHPNPEGNGDATLDFFSKEFDFSARETAAILGAHTLGKMYPQHSLLKYTWTVRAGHSFNNAYYKNIVRKTDWFIQSSDGQTCSMIGDAVGQLPDTLWVPTMNGFTKSGGPMHWIRMHYACNYCGGGGAAGGVYDKCCRNRPEGLACKPDNDTRSGLEEVTDGEMEGCERYRFAFGMDEMMMNAEAGLYFKFEEENGVPYNCPGLEDFNMETWLSGKMKDDRVRRALEMDCPLNDRRMPETDKSVSEIIQDYAEDQGLWLSDFIEAFEKMVSNGYGDGDLTSAPASWGDVQCKQKMKTLTCYII